jgi:RNA polymerase sigma factor (sigma-70 family)
MPPGIDGRVVSNSCLQSTPEIAKVPRWDMPEDLHHHGDEELAAIIGRRGRSIQAMSLAHAAMETLYIRHARPLRSFLAARVIPSADTDDVHQVVWQHVWSHLPNGFQGGNFRAWLYRIARNAAIDHGRKMRPDLVDDLETRPDPRGESPEAGLDEQARKDALSQCLAKLEAGLIALVRARLAGRSYEEINQELGLAPRRAHKMYHGAKKQLQTCVERALS